MEIPNIDEACPGSSDFTGKFSKILRNMARGCENPEIHEARTASDGKIVDGIGIYSV